jgi:hypothetical protein
MPSANRSESLTWISGEWSATRKQSRRLTIGTWCSGDFSSTPDCLRFAPSLKLGLSPEIDLALLEEGDGDAEIVGQAPV